VGYFVVQWAIPAGLKFVVIDAIAFPIIMALYEFVVRRLDVLRVLFGMKPKQRGATEARSVVTGQGA
jgi:hypothetical protein